MPTSNTPMWRKAPLQLVLCGFWIPAQLLASELPLPDSLRHDVAGFGVIYVPINPVASQTPTVQPWRQANQRVHQVGGWMFYATEAAADDPSKQHQQHQHQQTAPMKHEGHH